MVKGLNRQCVAQRARYVTVLAKYSISRQQLTKTNGAVLILKLWKVILRVLNMTRLAPWLLTLLTICTMTELSPPT